MEASLIIVFREVLEAALVVSIVLAVTKGVAGRKRWIGGGILAGILGALIVAYFANGIADFAQGFGQEIFNAGVLLAAVVLLSWHNVWMAKHGRDLAIKVSAVGQNVKDGTEPMYALASVVAVAILREGSEIVLFFHGFLPVYTLQELTTGSALGLLGGVALGAVLYFGLLKIPLKYFFNVTSWLILLLAAGLAANAAKYLTQADILPSLGRKIWDTSWLLDEGSFLGEILHVLIGYSAQPSGIQILFYALTIVIVGSMMMAVQRQMAKKPS